MGGDDTKWNHEGKLEEVIEYVNIEKSAEFLNS